MITKQAELAAINAVQSAIDIEGLDWVAGETSMSRLTPEEMKRIGVARVGPPIRGAPVLTRPQHLQGVADPPIFDWRDVDGCNWMTPVRSQGTCGSCWAFGASGVIEAVFNIYSGNPDLNIDISEQHVVSACCFFCGNCNGGWSDWVLEYCRDHGIPDEGCFPYVANDTPCTPCDDVDDRRYKITGYEYINSTTADFKWALQENGPMSVVLTIPNDWYFYTAGVYSPTSRAVGWANHAVVLVGWDDTRGAWIIKNSWGEGWGGTGKGYGLVDYGVLEGYNYAYAVTGIVYDDDDTVTCHKATNFNTGCDLLLHYDSDSDGAISSSESFDAISDHNVGNITQNEQNFVVDSYATGDINTTCPGCYGNTPPTAHASAIPTSGKAPLAVQFTGQGTDPDGTIQSYNWNFGDGNTTNIQSPAHTYSAAGAYMPTLTVTDDGGAIGSSSLPISVTSGADVGDGGWILPTSATSDPTCSVASLPPENAIDGDATTWWQTHHKHEPCWIQFDIGETKDIDAVSMQMRTGTTVDISVSTDAVNWTPVASSVHVGENLYDIIEFGMQTVRYVRVDIPDAYFKQLHEFRVFSIYGDGKFIPRQATASSSLDDGHLPNMAINGTYESSDCWFSNNEAPCWIQFDLGSQKTIDAVSVMTGNSPLPMTVVVNVSNDAVSWTPVTSDITIDQSYTIFGIGITPSTARYVKLDIVDANGIGGCCYFDVNVVGDTVVDLEVVNFVVQPTTCSQPCNATVSITWKNVGNTPITFTPEMSVNGDIYYSLPPQTVDPSDTFLLYKTVSGLTKGSYEICPVPN